MAREASVEAGVRLVLTGGGTGGHVYPALAIAQACARERALSPLRVTFVGSRWGLEARVVPAAGFAIEFVRAAPLERRAWFRLIATVFANVVGTVQAFFILHRQRPAVLVATGGYVTFPVVLAQRCARLVRLSHGRIALLEANAAAGLTNRILAPLADEMWYGYAPARRLRSKERVTGMPVRSELRERLPAGAARNALGLATDSITIVVMGGSQGARSLNDAAAGLAEGGLPATWQLLIVSGARDAAWLEARLAGRERVHLRAYLDDPRTAYAAADLVLSRSGASTLAELGATATPAVLVPYPHATRDHQASNARAYAAGGAAVIVPDAELTPARLRSVLLTALEPGMLDAMRTAARERSKGDPAATIAARVKALAAANEVAR